MKCRHCKQEIIWSEAYEEWVKINGWQNGGTEYDFCFHSPDETSEVKDILAKYDEKPGTPTIPLT